MWKRRLKTFGIALAVVAVLWASWITAARVIAHPVPNRIIGAVGHLVSGYCTAAGCGSNLIIDVGEGFEDDVVYDIVLCLDAECWEIQTILGDQAGNTGNPLEVEHEGTITASLDNVPRPLTSDVSLVVWADGEKMVRHEGTVTFEVHQPNGPFCEPTCYTGVVTI